MYRGKHWPVIVLLAYAKVHGIINAYSPELDATELRFASLVNGGEDPLLQILGI